MITNERQARISTKKLRDLEKHLAEFQEGKSDLDPKIQKATLDGIMSQIEELRTDLDTYTSIKNRERVMWRMSSLEDLPQLLIYARIAQGLTQAALAKKLKMRPQQIQRYESTCYSGASLKRIFKIASVLHLEIQDDQVPLLPPDAYEEMRYEKR
jgi:HTH-type transcriptional regulator/antitoxin HigA